MAELEMKEYEQLGRKKENTYDEIKVDKRKIEMDHSMLPSRIQFFKNALLVITMSLFSAGIVSTVTYFMVCELHPFQSLGSAPKAQLEQKLADIYRKLAEIEKINKTKLHETDIQENTNLDNYTMCYNGDTWQRLHESNRCVCAVGFLGKQCKYSDGKDTSFMVIFHEGRSHVSSPLPRILIASQITARLSVLYFNNNKNQSITIDKGNAEHNLSNSVIPSDGIHLAGVELQSDVRINVYGFLYQDRHSEGFLLMPVRFASTKYIIPTLPTFAVGEKNLLALSPVYQNTAVNINLKLKSGSITFQNKQYSNNDTIRIEINKYNTFQLSHTSDLSGTIVTSSKPVIAVSGNQCNYAVPANIHLGYCQPFIESVLPTHQLDNMFITPYISTRLNITVRIQAVNYTRLTITNGNRKISKTLNARDFWDFYYSTISYIFASDGILVVSYPHGLKGEKRDPFMMTIPGINQYLYEYDFVVPTGFDSFVSITVPRKNIDCFLLDGESFNITSVMNISDERIHFSTFSGPILDGVHHIEHGEKIRFGLWVYGNEFHEGYGYPAGMAYKIYN